MARQFIDVLSGIEVKEIETMVRKRRHQYLENEKPGHDLEVEEGDLPPEREEGDLFPEEDPIDESYGGYVRGWGILPIRIRSNRPRESRE